MLYQLSYRALLVVVSSDMGYFPFPTLIFILPSLVLTLGVLQFSCFSFMDCYLEGKLLWMSSFVVLCNFYNRRRLIINKLKNEEGMN